MFANVSNWFIRWLMKEKAHPGLLLSDFERLRYEVRPCDVLLIEGRSRVSEVIKTITQSSWSHAALYIGRMHDIEDRALREKVAPYFTGDPATPLLIEGVLGKGTIVTPLSAYQNDHIRICRPRGLAPRDAQEVMGYAINRLGTEYDVRQILDLARFLLPWTILPRNFHSSLFTSNVGHSTRTVCSTMLAEAFGSVEFPILPLLKKNDSQNLELIRRNPRLCTPSDFDYSPYFEIVKYPFVRLDESGTYRRLPWNREGFVNEDNGEIVRSPTRHGGILPNQSAAKMTGTLPAPPLNAKIQAAHPPLHTSFFEHFSHLKKKKKKKKIIDPLDPTHTKEIDDGSEDDSILKSEN